jgi:signal transduction histidine kinase
MIIDAFRRSAPWQDSASVDMDHALRVEDTLAHVRVVLFLLSLVVAILDPLVATRPAGALLLGLMLVYSLAGIVALRARKIRSPRDVAMLHVVDTAGILVVLVFTGGAVSPFSTLFLFVLLAAGYRWGQRETWFTAAAGFVVLGAHGVLLRLAQGPSSPDLQIVALRITYAGIGGVLIGYMAETERVERHSAWLVSTLLSRVRAEAGAVAAVQAVLDELMRQFRATHGVLAFDEDGSNRVALWHAERAGDPSRRVAIRLSQESKNADAIYSFPIPPAAHAFEVRRPRPGSPPDAAGVMVALDARGARLNEVVPATPLLGTPFHWQTVFCVSAMAGRGWTARLFLFMPHDPPVAREQLRYLRSVTRQVGPALFSLYLQRRLHSRAGVADRARISLELHDGIIQALIGIEMQLEVLRREAAGRVPDQVASQLTTIQRLLGEEILDVRDLMRLLKPEEVDATRLVEHLAAMVERFRHRTSIQARVVCDADEIDLTPRACREVAGIVQEALTNVRKHSGATKVVVRLERSGVDWTLTVDDNGCGLDFEGHLTQEEIDVQRKGPDIIKERVRAIGGSLALRSHRGSGTQIEVTIPAKHYA